MPRFGSRRRRGSKAPAVVHFTSAKNDDENRQLCVYAECQMVGTMVGPTWGHSESSVRRALAELTSECECGAKFHRAFEYVGKRINKLSRRK